ncbi:Prohead protease [uncultured Caudovirales phage]|uniref:Prohead protease n=3 Tax=uncultured Caudovirales phage TaxID=2100421 RepID=A0A6J5S5M9_9CAUD|nr:Prohead protease [uncultured Caudovirales phage]CAB4203819.1 Prohead protease [uncultured Caudovirales phage]
MADLTPNAGMAAAAQQGLEWRAEGLGGDGLVEATITDARKMANREALSESKVRRMPAWFARHAVDLEAPQNDPDNENYPGAGRVAWQLWGGDAGRSWADVKVRQLDEETRNLHYGLDHIIAEVDGTLLDGTAPIVKTIDFINGRPEPVCIVSGRKEAERADTVAALDAAGVEYYELYLNDTEAGTIEFKTMVAEELMTEYNVVLAVDNDEAARAAYNTLGIATLAPDDIPEAAGAADQEEDAMNPFRHTAPVKLEVRESAMGAEYLTVTGYAAVFDQMSHDLGGFREVIQPGAFADVLGANPDVHLVIGHNMDLPLARTRNGTLELGEDIRGLKMWARIDSRLSYAKDLAVQLKSGLVDQMSFAFTIPEGGDTWSVDESGAVTRTVNRIDGLYDVSVVAAGAYPQTDVKAVRALLRAAADRGLIPNLLDTSQPETVGGDSVEQHAGGTVESDTGGRQAIQNLQAAKAKTKAALHNHSKGL